MQLQKQQCINILIFNRSFLIKRKLFVFEQIVIISFYDEIHTPETQNTSVRQ